MAEGGCHCGAVRYAAAAPAARAGLCHCTDCRKSAGAPMVAWTIFPLDAFRLLRGEPAVYASSGHGRRAFCPACGTGLFYTNDQIFPGLIDIQTATFDDPGAFPPNEQVQVADRIVWMEHAHALPAFERFPEDL